MDVEVAFLVAFTSFHDGLHGWGVQDPATDLAALLQRDSLGAGRRQWKNHQLFNKETMVSIMLVYWRILEAMLKKIVILGEPTLEVPPIYKACVRAM